MNKRNLLLALVCLFLNACAPGDGDDPSAAAPLAGAAIGGTFELTDENGDPFSSEQLAGKYRILYFGYSYCPDVCPVDLRNAMQGLQLAEKKRPELAEQVQPLFITIDPERDTPEAIRTYTENFHPRLIGLTGSAEQIAAVAEKYLILYKRREVEGMSDYLMDHSRQTYLMGPDGAPIALLSHDGTPQQVAEEILQWVK